MFTDVVALHGVSDTDQIIGKKTVGVGKRNARNGTDCQNGCSALNEAATRE